MANQNNFTVTVHFDNDIKARIDKDGDVSFENAEMGYLAPGDIDAVQSLIDWMLDDSDDE